jgi:hypothetical protein
MPLVLRSSRQVGKAGLEAVVDASTDHPVMRVMGLEEERLTGLIAWNRLTIFNCGRYELC